jgi:hypothetical protein
MIPPGPLLLLVGVLELATTTRRPTMTSTDAKDWSFGCLIDGVRSTTEKCRACLKSMSPNERAVGLFVRVVRTIGLLANDLKYSMCDFLISSRTHIWTTRAHGLLFQIGPKRNRARQCLAGSSPQQQPRADGQPLHFAPPSLLILGKDVHSCRYRLGHTKTTTRQDANGNHGS